jgi:hypothetical protein
MIENPARARRHLFAALAAGLLLALTGVIPLQTEAPSHSSLFLVLTVAGTVIAIAASVALMIFQVRAVRRSALRSELYDELSNRNAVRAMAVGYVVLASGAAAAVLTAAFFPLPALPVLTAVLLLGIAAHIASFAWFERQGDDD